MKMRKRMENARERVSAYSLLIGVESTKGRCCTRKRGFARGEGGRVHGESAKGGLRKNVSGEGCNTTYK
jgi:hypothetical protein